MQRLNRKGNPGIFTSSAVVAGLCATILSCALSARAQTRSNPFPLSEKRTAIVRLEADRFVEEKGFEGLSDIEIYDLLTAAVVDAKIDCRLRPTGTLQTMEKCKEAARKAADKDVEKALPMLKPEQLEAEAAEKYPLLQKGTRIEVLFMPNPARQVKVKGVYQGFDGQNMIINRKRYQVASVRFLDPASKDALLLLDTERNGEKRKTYVSDTRSEHLGKRSLMLEDKIRTHMRQEVVNAIRENEANHYIFYSRQWHSLKDVVRAEIAQRKTAWLAEKQRKEEEERLKAEEAARLAAEEAAADPEMPVPPDQENFFQPPGNPPVDGNGAIGLPPEGYKPPPRKPGAGVPRFIPQAPTDGAEAPRKPPANGTDVFRPIPVVE